MNHSAVQSALSLRALRAKFEPATVTKWIGIASSNPQALGTLIGAVKEREASIVAGQHDRVGDTADGATPDNTPISTHDKGFMSIVAQAAAAAGVATPPFVHRQMSAGMSGDDVSEWQGMLGITQTGVFDAATVAATKAFQKSKGLAADGIAGRDTIAAMFGENAALPPAPTPARPDPPPAVTPSQPAPAAPVAPMAPAQGMPFWEKLGIAAGAAFLGYKILF